MADSDQIAAQQAMEGGVVEIRRSMAPGKVTLNWRHDELRAWHGGNRNQVEIEDDGSRD